MRDDSKRANQSPEIVTDSTGVFRAVRTHEPVRFIEQAELIWQAQYFDGTQWQCLSYYATPERAIDGAKEGKRIADILEALTG